MIAPPGTEALPLLPFAIEVLVESKVASWVEQSLTAQTWKVTLPKSFGSGSLKVAVSAGVALLSCAAFAEQIRSDRARWAAVAKKSNIRLE